MARVRYLNQLTLESVEAIKTVLTISMRETGYKFGMPFA